jgi:hypothetical protein
MALRTGRVGPGPQPSPGDSTLSRADNRHGAADRRNHATILSELGRSGGATSMMIETVGPLN